MCLWFVGTAVLAVAYVFRDPAFDYRLLIVGALLPLADAVTGGAGVLHTLAFSLALMVAVMLSTVGQRRRRKLLLGLPIGTLLHLVFDGAWATTDLFWWPFGGWSLEDVPLPEAARGWLDVPLELAGLAMVGWIWRRSHLGSPAARRAFLADGRLLT